MTERAGWKNWERHKRAIACTHSTDEFGAGKLGSVEFEPSTHPVEDFPRRVDRDVVKVDPFNSNFTCAESFSSIISPACKRQM